MPQFGPVYNQSTLGSCSAFASTSLMSWKGFVETGAWEEFSELAQYFNERTIAGTVQEDSGATMPEAIKALLYYLYGSVLEALTFPVQL